MALFRRKPKRRDSRKHPSSTQWDRLRFTSTKQTMEHENKIKSGNGHISSVKITEPSEGETQFICLGKNTGISKD